MSDKQKRFKYIMVIIAVVGVLGTVIPNLLDTSYATGKSSHLPILSHWSTARCVDCILDR